MERIPFFNSDLINSKLQSLTLCKYIYYNGQVVRVMGQIEGIQMEGGQMERHER